MKVLIDVGTSNFLSIDASNAGPLLASLSCSELFLREGWGSNEKFVRVKDGVKISIVQDDFLQDAEPPLKAAQEEAAKNSTRWLDEYHKHQETKKTLAALQEKVKSAGISFEDAKAA